MCCKALFHLRIENAKGKSTQGNCCTEDGRYPEKMSIEPENIKKLRCLFDPVTTSNQVKIIL